MPLTSRELESRAKRREILPSIFVVLLLIGIAYQEMVDVVRDSVRSQVFTTSIILLFTVFFLTTMRFFVGDQLHLQSEEMQVASGFIWFFDLMVIVLQVTIIIFLGGLASLGASYSSPIVFGLLIALYSFDVSWIVLQYLMGKLSDAWKRRFIPWRWGLLNTILIILMSIIYYVAGGFYSDSALLVLSIINTIGFVADM